MYTIILDICILGLLNIPNRGNRFNKVKILYIIKNSFYPTYLTYSIMELKDKDNFEFSIGH